MIEPQLSEMIVKQTNLRDLAIEQKNLEIERLKDKLNSIESAYEHSKSEAEGRGKNAKTLNIYQDRRN